MRLDIRKAAALTLLCNVKLAPSYRQLSPEQSVVQAWMDRPLELNPGVTSHPQVRVWLTPVRDRSWGKKNFGDNRIYETLGSRIVDVPVGAWPVLKIGSLWRRGEQIGSPLYDSKRFVDVRLSDSQSPVMFSNATFTEIDTSGEQCLRPFIPVDQYPFCFDRSSSRLTLMQGIDNGSGQPTTLVIPCAELARFYYFSSTRLTVTLLGAEPFTSIDRGLINPRLTFFDRETAVAYLRLRWRMFDSDALEIGLIGFSKYAWRCARDLHESLIRNRETCGFFALDARPPFEEALTLDVRGTTIRSGSRSFFLVFSIEGSTLPLPFKKLLYTRDNDGRSDGSTDLERPVANFPRRRARTISKDDRGSVLRSDDEPDIRDGSTIIQLTEKRFSDLVSGTIEKLEKEQCQFRAAKKNRLLASSATEYSMGDGVYRPSGLSDLQLTVRLKPSMTAEKTSRCLRANIENFKKVLGHLETLDDLVVDGVSLDGLECVDSFCLFMPVFGAWSYINRPAKQRRRVIVARVQFRGSNFYLFEIERRSRRGDKEENFAALILHDENGCELAPELIQMVLEMCAGRKGVWLNENQSDLKRAKMHHGSTNVDAFAQRFYRYFLEKTECVSQVKLSMPDVREPAHQNRVVTEPRAA